MGPADVLDYAAQSFTFGGKICLDATLKMHEEKTIKPKDEIKKFVNISNVQAIIEKI